MQKIENFINGAKDKYLAFIDWVSANPQKYVWASIAFIAAALVL